jgi:surface antigen
MSRHRSAKPAAKLVVAIASLGLLSACAAGPGEVGFNKTTAGGLAGAAGGAFAGARLFGGNNGLIGKGSTTQMAGVAGATLLGALLGGSIGSSLDRADQPPPPRAEARRAPPDIRWSDPESERPRAAPARVIREGRDRDTGELCREFVQEIEVGGKVEKGWGIACQQDDGSWRVVQR